MRPTLLMLTMLLSGCASVSSIPLSKDTFQVVANASSHCSADNAQKAAFQEAAVETIRKGFDSFVIIGSDRQSEVAGASVWGGNASYSHEHSQALTVKMFKDGDPGSAQAISARETLGPKWQEMLNGHQFSCA